MYKALWFDMVVNVQQDSILFRWVRGLLLGCGGTRHASQPPSFLRNFEKVTGTLSTFARLFWKTRLEFSTKQRPTEETFILITDPLSLGSGSGPHTLLWISLWNWNISIVLLINPYQIGSHTIVVLHVKCQINSYKGINLITITILLLPNIYNVRESKT